MLYIYIGISRNGTNYNLQPNHSNNDTESNVEDLFMRHNSLETIKVYQYSDDKMKLKKTYTK